MKKTVTYPYDSFDTKTVFNIFTQKTFIEKKYASVGVTHLEFIDYGEKDGTFIIHTKRVVAAEVPGFAKKFIQPTTTVIQTELWTLTDEAIKKGTVRVEARGLPMKMSGDIILQPMDHGCENVLTYDITVNIPLIGGKLAKYLDEEGRKTANREYDFAIQFLRNTQKL
ncbi:MAG: DUF2505 domain-containing protein [Candidatus Magnetomorum sp.]|nr:DUF2505 domain-containing protein [Candidatus Magnetomorum sp.]